MCQQVRVIGHHRWKRAEQKHGGCRDDELTAGRKAHCGRPARGALSGRTSCYDDGPGTPSVYSVTGHSARFESALRTAAAPHQGFSHCGVGVRNGSSVGTADPGTGPSRWLTMPGDAFSPSVSFCQLAMRRKYGSPDGDRMNQVEQPSSSYGFNAWALSL